MTVSRWHIYIISSLIHSIGRFVYSSAAVHSLANLGHQSLKTSHHRNLLFLDLLVQYVLILLGNYTRAQISTGAETVGGIATTVSVTLIPEYAKLQEFRGAVITWLASSAVCDVIITTSLVTSLVSRA